MSDQQNQLSGNGAVCSSCGRELSADHLPGIDPESILCDLCIATRSVSEITEKVSQQDQRRSERQDQLVDAPVRSARNRRLIMGISALILLIVNLVLYFSINPPPIEPIEAVDDPVGYLFLLESVLLDYADDHGGTFPDDLAGLMPDYLYPDEMPTANPEAFRYRRPTPHSYELSLEEGAAGTDDDLVLTGESGG